MCKPILFIIFNRWETALEVFYKIREAKPSRLYVAADGPRKEKIGEIEKCHKVRNIINLIDWDCEIKTLFQDNNLGCKLGVYNAINWFFENEDEGIILEDDVVPKLEFFDFCEKCLEKYRDNDKIFSILGFNQFGQEITSNGYYYSRGYYAWGWASWRSRWKKYKLQLDKKDIAKIYKNKNYPYYVLKINDFNLQLIRKGILDTWDYQMVYQVITTDSYNIVPFANLITNIGTNGAHSSNNTNIFHKYGNMNVNNLEHPTIIDDNKKMNEMLWKEYKSAFPFMFFKSLLFKIGIYKTCRYLIKLIR